jgi:hypothetical protein
MSKRLRCKYVLGDPGQIRLDGYLADITYLIRGEGFGFANDFVPLRRRLVERVHHEMQIGRQSAHACYLGLLCP